MRKYLILVIGVCICALPCFASDWVLVEKSNKFDGYYVDRDSIRFYKAKYSNDKLIKAWVKTNYKNVQTLENNPSKKYLSEKKLGIFNCTENSYSVVQGSSSSETDGNGDLVDSWDIPEIRWKFTEVIPDSIGETIFKNVCNYAKTLNE